MITVDAGGFFGLGALRVGLVVGCERLITGVRAINQFNYFCLADPVQRIIGDMFVEAIEGSEYINNTNK